MLKELRRAVRERRSASDAAVEKADGDGDGEAVDAAAHADRPLAHPSVESTESAEAANASQFARVDRPAILARAKRVDDALAVALGGLDDDQLVAVVAVDDVAVCAAVGSGKTTVLVHRVWWLVRVVGVALDRIVVLTFTRKAAREIIDRLSGASQGQTPPLMGTFHSVARTLLATTLPVESLGFTRSFRILDTSERDALLVHLIAHHGLDIKHRRRLQARLTALAEGRVRIGNMRKDDDIVELAERYEADKRAKNAMDYDDLLVGCGALLPQLSQARRPLHIIVDELQDCDSDQLDLIEALRGDSTRLFAVGDPHQTIYGWRGSRTDVFALFAARFGARNVALPRNYRATAELVHAAAGLLVATRSTLDAAAGQIRPTRGPGELVRILRHHDDVAEARWIANALAARDPSAPPKRYAVLARTRRQLEAVAAACGARGVTTASTTAREPAQSLARWLHALILAGVDADNLSALRISLCDPKRGLVADKALDPAALAVFEGDAHQRVGARLEAMARRSRKVNRGLCQRVMAALASMVADDQPRQHDTAAADRLPPWQTASLPIDDLLGPTRADYQEDRALAQRLLTAWWHAALEFGGGTTGLRRALDEALVDSDWLLPSERIEDAGGVALMTIHGAKGLEFDHVWLIGVNDGALPVAGAMAHPDQLAEEQRLLFVAMTRARSSLEISWLTRPSLPRATGAPSPLLRLLPAATVQWHDAPSDNIVASTPPATLRWAVAARVRHPRHGVGVVTESESERVTVRFDRVGEKTFSPSMVPLIEEATDDSGV